MRRFLTSLLALGLLLVAIPRAVAATPAATGPATPATEGPARIAVRARAFDGTRWLPSAVVVLTGDRIESVSAGPAQPQGGATLIDIPGTILTPGFIDCDSSLGIARMRDEPQEAASPDLLLADAFAPDEGESEALRRSGVTMAWLAAGPRSVVGARAALIQPSASGGARILDADHGLCASLTSAASVPDRAPTSVPARAALIAHVADEFSNARPLRIRFDNAGSARVAAGMLSARDGGLLVGLPTSDESLAEIATASAPAPAPSSEREQPRLVLCLSGLGPSSSMDQLRLAMASANQVPFVLGTGSAAAGPRTLRWAAAALVAQGASPDRVLAALTRDAARALQAGRRGVIEPGATADLVLWSGDPLSPTSRVLRAWVSGEEVHVEK